jgi:hypothetical protein
MPSRHDIRLLCLTPPDFSSQPFLLWKQASTGAEADKGLIFISFFLI